MDDSAEECVLLIPEAGDLLNSCGLVFVYVFVNATNSQRAFVTHCDFVNVAANSIRISPQSLDCFAYRADDAN